MRSETDRHQRVACPLIRQLDHLINLFFPRPEPCQVRCDEHRRGDDAAQACRRGRFGHVVGKEVHLVTGRDAVEQEFTGSERHGRRDVVRGQLALARPHHFGQPPRDGQALPGPSQEHHRGVGMGVHKPGNEKSVQGDRRAIVGRSRLGGARPLHPPLVHINDSWRMKYRSIRHGEQVVDPISNHSRPPGNRQRVARVENSSSVSMMAKTRSGDTRKMEFCRRNSGDVSGPYFLM